MIVRDETPGDAAGVRRLLLSAFGGAAEADLVERLHAEGDAAIALVAEEDGEVVGHVVFSPMAAPFAALGLGPVATAEARRGEGVAGALIREGIGRARAQGVRAVFVLGDPVFYGRFGFDAAKVAGFGSPYAGPHFMVLALNGPLPVREGPVAYAPAFAGL